MSDIDDGGPAFPISDASGVIQKGMSVRDYFAAQAINGFLAAGMLKAVNDVPDEIVGMAYALADDVIDYRSRHRSEA